MGKFVKSLFGGAKVPKAPAPPPPPTDNTQAVKDAEAAQRQRAAIGGRASTMLTGGEGVEDDAVTAKKKLLGS